MSFETGGDTALRSDKARIYNLPKVIHLPKDIDITGELVKQLIDNHISNNVPRYQQLQGYYEGWAAIMNRQKDAHKANNRIISGYPSYITDILLGMFVGKPINYSVSEDNQDNMDELQEIFNLNDEQDENTEVAKICSIKGRAYEIVYQDEESNTRFNELEPDNVVYVYDDKINPDPLFAIYFHEALDIDNIFNDDKEVKATVYTRDEIITYISDEGDYAEDSRKAHPFDRLPIVEFLNNDEGIGDFERVLSYIDDYNRSVSDTSNDFEEFTDAILLLYGLLNTDSDDVKQLMEDRVLALDKVDGNQGAEWLIKEINDTALENHNKRLDNDIHKFAKVPNIADEQFAGNVSGESMKYKLLAMDQVISAKQRKFKTGLQDRLQLILKIASIKGKGMDYRDIEITFQDNKPINEKDNVEMVTRLKGVVSESTALSRLDGLDDVSDELKRIEEERGPYPTVDKYMDEYEDDPKNKPDEEDDEDEDDR